MEGLQIATYNNRVIEIVPDYRLKETSDGTITITKDSVEQATYAPFSENDQTEGMYIQSYSINEEGRSEKEWYEQNLLVAIVDLNYRFLSPINSNTPDKPNTPSPKNIISNDGCVEINNNQQTIVRGESYIATLSTKQGFSRIPNGHIEMQTGNDTWETKQSWTNKATVAISVDNVIGNLRFVFDEECVYNLTIRRTLNGQSWPECPIGETEVVEKHCSDSIDTDSEEIKKPITNYLINSVTPSGQITPCTNTEITVDYKPANSPLVLTWYDTTEKIALHTNDSLSVPSGEVWDEEALNVERQKITIDPKVYEYDNMSPTSVAGDGYPKAVVFNYHKIPYTVTYNVGEHVHMPDSSTQSTYYNGEVSERTYTIDEGFTLSSSYTEEAATVVIENGRINVTNIVKNVTINLSAASTVESIFASNMDAMGGVRLYAKYTDGTTEIINPAEATLNSYTIGSTTTNVSEQENVEVYDYNFIDNNNYTGEDKITTATKEIIRKKRVPLENPTTSDVSNISLNVTYNGFNQDISGITQRAEVYGYYEGGLKSNSNSSDLKTVDATTSNWKTNYLVDFGDSSNMYGDTGPTEQNPDKVKIGLDIYNKDITPYYIPGTDIGENPLLNITSDNVKYKKSNDSNIYDISNVRDNLNIDFNKPEDNSSDYEHYHILWQEESKGRIFSKDELESNIEYCGLYDTTCGCTPQDKAKSSELYTLEAGQKSDSTNIKEIDKDPSVIYTVYYEAPSHNYGRDSISYYHTQLENYAAKVDENIFKDSNKQSLSFSYPVHISTYYYGNDVDHGSSSRYWSTSLINPNYYKFNSVRWESSTDASVLIPDNNSYTQYYDYNNRIDIDVPANYNNRTYSDIKILPYNTAYYPEENGFNKLSVGDSYNSSDEGREVTVYYTMMSPENQVRPTNPTENVYKFIKLDGIYNGADYSHDYNYEENLIELEDINNYISEENKNNHVTYISFNYKNTNDKVYEPLNNNQKYLYNKHKNYSVVKEIGENKDYSYKCENKEYAKIDAPIIEDVENGIYYPYRLYNLSTGIQIRQYYNDPTDNRPEHAPETNHYLYNSDYTKYVACAESFKKNGYYYYYPSGTSDSYDWWINNYKNIVSIRPGQKSYYIITLTGGTELTNCVRTYVDDDNSQYYSDNRAVLVEQTLALPTIYTNATQIRVDFVGGNCDNGNNTVENCGIGTFKVKVGDETSEWVNLNATDIHDRHYEYHDNRTNNNLEIVITANTKTPELIELLSDTMSSEARHNWILGSTPVIDPETGEQAIDPDTGEGIVTPNILTYRENMFTGGGRFIVTAYWNDTNDEEGQNRIIDTRIMIIDIGGSCSRSNNPNKEGCKIPWEDFVKYYHKGTESYYDNTYYSSKLEFKPVPPTVINNEPLAS